MATLDPQEVTLVTQAVAACASEQKDQLTGRKVTKSLLDLVRQFHEQGVPMYTIVTGLWVVIHALAEEWKDAQL